MKRWIVFKGHRFVVLGALLVLMLCGCGKSSESQNLKLGDDALMELRYQEALAYYTAAVSAGEAKELAWRGVGIAHMGMAEYEPAMEAFQEALLACDCMPNDLTYDLNYYLAAALYKLDDYVAAQDIYTAILQLRPREIQAYYLRGVTRLQMQQLTDAVADFDRSLALDGYNTNLYIDIYQSLLTTGHEEEGKEYLEKALEDLAAQMDDYSKGKMHYYLGNYSDASYYFEKSMQVGDGEAVLFLGLTYEAQGDVNQAINTYTEHLLQSEGMSASEAAIYNRLGLCCLARKEYPQALEAFQNAMSIQDNGMMQTLKMNEIVAYEYLSEFAQARTLLAEYLLLYPDDMVAAREADFLATR